MGERGRKRDGGGEGRGRNEERVTAYVSLQKATEKERHVLVV